MPDFEKMKNVCDACSAISAEVLDQFLVPYCGQQEDLERYFAKELSKYRDVVQEMPEEWPFWVVEQFVAHRLFRKNGFALRYLNHREVKMRSAEERAFLVTQVQHHWRFTYCRILNSPAPHFFDIEDVFNGGKYLLYSQGLPAILEQKGALTMLFLLIGFNGECWQSYGPIIYFRGIEPFDILFFAQQIDSNISDGEDVRNLIDKHPAPFMLTAFGSEYPIVVHENDRIIFTKSEFSSPEFSAEGLEKRFHIKQKDAVHKLELKRWRNHPHYATCFNDSNKKILYLSAGTARGYAKLIEALNEAGYDLPMEAQQQVTPPMVSIVLKVLKKKFTLSPFDALFEEPIPEHQAQHLTKMNTFLDLLMQETNAGKPYDIDALAKRAGIDSETAHNIIDAVNETMNKH